MIPSESKTLQLPGSTSTNKGISDMPNAPSIGFEITDVGTGVRYKVVSAQDARQGNLQSPNFLDYIAMLERA
jgi:hypothetical protein